MRIQRLCSFAAACFFLAIALCPTSQTQETAEPARRLVKLEQERSDLQPNLEYLCDMIGPRLTGAARLKRANEWVAERMREYGLENVHQEPYTIPSTWERGEASVRVVSPTNIALQASQSAWTRGTRGSLRGTLIKCEPITDAELESFKEKLRGAIVLLGTDLRPPTPSGVDSWTEPTRPGDIAAFPSESPGHKPPPPTISREFSIKRSRVFEKEGVIAQLTPSGKPYQLLSMRGSWDQITYPRFFVGNDSVAMLHRLLKRGRVEIEITSTAKLSRKPGTCYNTVGEIRGSDPTGEQVIIGAHLDSWDLGVGATDNGTGSMCVLEAARLIKALGVRPGPSIKFVLFTGEEQGLVGSKEYVRAHKDELSRISAVFVHDNGTGRVRGVRLQQREACRAWFEQQFATFRELGLFAGPAEIRSEKSENTDHAPFSVAGVPAFDCVQDHAEYGLSHHTQADMLDRVRWSDLKQGATVLAILAWEAAQVDKMLPR